MLFSPDTIGAYLDWRTQEIGIAAVESDDAALKAAYASGDVYHALARMCGLTNDPDRVRWKREHPDVRARMKPLQLGINYGMGVPSLARGLDRHPLIASGIIERHRRDLSALLAVARRTRSMTAMLERRIESSHGWPLRISTSPNIRTLYNFPMQSGGAEMLRLAAWRMCEAGIVPIMLIHDGILLEETDLGADRARQGNHAAGRARRLQRLRDRRRHRPAAQRRRPRYYDKRPMAKKMWATIMNALKAVGAIPEREAA